MRRVQVNKFLSWVVAAVSFSIAPAYSAEKEFLELEQRISEWRQDFWVNDDYSVVKTNHVTLQLLSESAAKSAKDYTFSYSTSIEKVEVLEAYTLKSDGSKIEVPPGNYQVTTNQGSGEGGPVFSDRTSTTIVFPDLEMNDSIAFTLRTTESEPMFPGQFALRGSFYDQSAYDDARVTINMPDSFSPRMQFRDLKKRTRKKDGRTIIELKYRHSKPVKTEREDFSVWDWDTQPGFSVSSFKSYQEIAEAYGERATPKAQPTQRIRTLAAEIIGDEENARERARLLYDWVATTISYAGNCIGVGAVVPHDTDFILDNRMGDCKDHATLLQALYTSVGIRSIQALINSGSSYHLPEIPMVSSVNHVITYIPQFEQFVDSTNASMPFETLGFSVSDKPVLLVEEYVEGMRTPAGHWEADAQVAKSKVHIRADGSAAGELSVKLSGSPAVQTRAFWRELNTQQEQEWVEGMFDGNSQKGTAVLTRENPKPLTSEFSYSVEFTTPEQILSEGAGGMHIYTLGFSPFSPHSFLPGGVQREVDHEVVCHNGHTVEDIRYQFDEGIRILAVPDDFRLEENHLSYQASYLLEGDTVTVHRELQDKTPGNVCAPALVNAQRDSYEKIRKNLRSQLVYQHYQQ